LNSSWEVCGEAENGEVAIEKASRLHPNLVILDLQMPVMNGLEAARRIAQVSPETTMIMFTRTHLIKFPKAPRKQESNVSRSLRRLFSTIPVNECNGEMVHRQLIKWR
jgi:chemotaxis response regulator CheB